MNFNITFESLKKLHSEGELLNPSRLQQLTEPSGLDTDFYISPATLVQVKSQLTSIYKPGKAEWKAKNPKWQPLDVLAAIALHRLMPNLPMEIATFKGFWRYLSVHCCDVVSKRYGYSEIEKQFEPKHFGNEIFESILPRLWFRAEFSKDTASDDMYWLTKKGSSDFWSSFVFRTVYVQSTSLIRAMVKYFYIEDDISFERNGLPFPKAEAIRKIGPAVRRQHSLSPFELMNEEDCFNTLELLASELKIRRLVSEDRN